MTTPNEEEAQSTITFRHYTSENDYSQWVLFLYHQLPNLLMQLDAFTLVLTELALYKAMLNITNGERDIMSKILSCGILQIGKEASCKKFFQQSVRNYLGDQIGNKILH